MLKKQILILALFIAPLLGVCQYGIGVYHLGDRVVQGNHMNAAFVPNAKLWIGLPLSASVDLNSSHAFNEYFTKSEGRQTLDYDRILKNAGASNATIFNARLNTFSVGAQISEDIGSVYLFTNERVLGYISYPKEVIRLISEGNVALLDQDVKLSDLRFSFNYFREIGLGFTVKPAKGVRR